MTVTAARLFDPDALDAPDEPRGDDPLCGPGGRAFTPEQAAAVRAREGSWVVSATAGSGKTSVLVERFVRAVREDGTDPSAILAITFTDKAAGELRRRVRDRFLELGDRASARAAEGASISTIHGFCAGVLRSHALAAALDPRFAVLDEVDAQRLAIGAFDAALATWLEEAAAAGHERLELAAAYKPDGLRKAILAVHAWLRTRGHRAPRLPRRTAPDAAAARKRARKAAKALGPFLRAANGGTRVDQARAALTECEGLLDELPKDVLPPAARLDPLSFTAQGKALDDPVVAAYLDAVKGWRQACLDTVAVAALELLDRLLELFGAEYARAKDVRSAVDFEDLELLVRDLLAGDDGLRRATASRWELVMVDEFQDTNPLQAEILDLLDRDATMVVGDEHQSIYGFRHADVELFRARRAALGERGRAAELPVSFRARPELVDAIDAIFALRFGPDFVPLESPPDAPGRDGEPRLELLLTGEHGWEESHPGLGDGLPPTRQSSRHAEARLLAQRIAEVVDAGEAEPREVAVLVRAATDIAVYERALRDAGLAATVTGGRGYWDDRQVRDLCAHLAAVANARDERRLFELLASPLVGLSSDGLALLAMHRRERGVDAWRALREAFAGEGSAAGDGPLAGEAPAAGGGPLGSLPPADRAALLRWVPWFEAERRGAARRSIATLVERALRFSGYDLHVLALPGGERRMANVRKLQRLAREHEERAGRDLRAFLDLVDLQRELEVREPEAPVEGEGVQLMTIHAAKGLEWDVVCLADLGRNGRGDGPVLRVGDDDRVGLRVATIDGERDKALDYEALEKEAKAREEAEEERVMYVAMTRARKRLILSGVVDLGRWPKPSPRGAPLSWLAPAIDPGIADADEVPVREVRREVGEWTLHARIALNTPATVGEVLRTASLKPAPVGGGGRAPAESGPATARTTRPAALTAPHPAPPSTLSYSSLAAYARCPYRWYLERVLGLPEDRSEKRGAPDEDTALTALERGSVVHALLEEIDLRRPRVPAPEAIAEAVRAESEREPTPADVADATALIEAFLASPLAARLGSAPRLRAEAGFAFPLALGPGEPTLVTGFVDAMAVEPTGAVVVDYKTDRLGGEAPEALVARAYGAQRIVYALAALHEGAQRVEVVHLFLEAPEQPATAAFTAADRPALERDLAALAGGMVAQDFTPTDRPHASLCLGCPGRRALCSHTPEHTLRDAPDPPVPVQAGS